jgi:hypothetical protein
VNASPFIDAADTNPGGIRHPRASMLTRRADDELIIDGIAVSDTGSSSRASTPALFRLRRFSRP